jgi:2-methylcitrate dehydratase PrpD
LVQARKEERKMGLTYEIAKFVVEKGHNDFLKEDIEVVKNLVFDALGVMIGGCGESVVQRTIRYVKDSGGVEECGVLGGKFRTSLTNAVLINGTSAHAQELESEGVYSGSLPMTNIPVALNVAEKFKLSGKAVIEGIIIGLEVETKLGMGGPGAFDRGFSSIPTFGTFGAAATAGKMMKLSIDQMQHAFGIGTAQCSGQQRQQGSMTHLLEAGIACRNGVTAALLAKEGVMSDPNLIEGERGFYDLFCSGGRGYDTEAVIRSLGNPFCITSPGILIKKYANCFFNQRAMDALLQLMKENDIRYDAVDNVQVEIPTFIAKMLNRFPDPKSGAEAQFSLCQSLGSILADGKADLPSVRPFTDGGAKDPRYQEARKKVKVVEHTEWVAGRSTPWWTPVTVSLKDGREFTKTVERAKGEHQNPLSRQELVARHKALVQEFLSPKQNQRSVDLAFDLENLENISELMKLVTFGKD